MATEQRLVAVPGERPGPSAEAARLRVGALLDEVSRLDAELEELSRRLDDFARRWEAEVGPALAELAAAEGLVHRLQRIEDELGRLALALRQEGAGLARARRRSRRGPESQAASAGAAREEAGEAGEGAEEEPAPGPAPGAAPEIAAAEVLLKRLWRRLARVLHPDLADGEADRERLTGLMARANGAYEAGDLAGLELLAERIGAGEDPEAPDEAARLAHLARREEALRAVRRSLREEEARLRASATARLSAQAERQGDLAAESRDAAASDAAAAREDAQARLERIFEAAGALARQRRTAMDRMQRRGPTGALRPFDPVAESPLVRQGLLLAEARRAGPAARELARWLEERAQAESPWEAALTLLAYLAEAAGAPPETLASAEALAATWAAVVEGWAAPDLPRALAHLPRHLALGMRLRGKELHFGAQLASADLAPGVRLALRRERVGGLLRRVLSALGPALRCRGCRAERRALHLLRLRGPDEVHGLVCPACGSVLRSYWQYGEAGGLEALAPLALEAGLVAEIPLRFAGAPLALQLLPEERRRLTGAALRERLAEVLFAPYRIEIGPRQLRLAGKQGEIGARHRVPPGRIAMGLGAGPLGEPEALELLRSRIERRFRE